MRILSSEANVFNHFDGLLQKVISLLSTSSQAPTITGYTSAAKSLFLLRLAQQTLRTTLIVTRTEAEADAAFEDLLFFEGFFRGATPRLHRFPDWDLSPYQVAVPSINHVALRMQTLNQLSLGHPVVVVASIASLVRKILPQNIFRKSCLDLASGKSLERETLVKHCLCSGYRNVSIVQDPGEFSVRGGLVDIFSTAHDFPLRLEFLGDTLESIRPFDIDSQISGHEQKSALLLPAREYILNEFYEEAFQVGIDWMAPTHYPSMATLSDYCSDPPIIVLDEPKELLQVSKDLEDNAKENWSNEFPSPEDWYASFESLSTEKDGKDFIVTEQIPHAYAFSTHDKNNSPVCIDLACRSLETFGLGVQGASFSTLIESIEELRSRGLVFVIARSDGQANRLITLFGEHNLPTKIWTSDDLNLFRSSNETSPIYVSHGVLSSGFFIASFGAMIREEDLFAKSTPYRPQRHSKNTHFLPSVEDMKIGDLVVYVQHGIGRFAGLGRLEISDYEQEFFKVEYAGNDIVYVPLDRMNQVQRYQTQEGHVPRLDSLRGTRWNQTKSRVKKSIEDMAEELLDLYSRREVVDGFQYGEDTLLSHEFDAAFEYEATTDQLRAIDDVKQNMESSRPMDRLVCGDVGYGKTEVAMRAAFKAVLDNRQVAILVPTTLLANQHFQNFSRRFAPFAVTIGILSRFQSSKEQSSTLASVKAGSIDILIGTHRLLQKDVNFKTLGLVIIDEEQWFGVRHKERLKQLRHAVDVLTLTATPIPRTLQLSMSALRDLSVIDTPPPGRLAIKTQVLRTDDRVVREAIHWELRRGGQVFFVHNKVASIEQIGLWITELVPEAKIGIAHGQMDTRALESVMLQFLEKDITVLIATAIIQSGLDIPSANTIIVNRADQFGLAQLYQLRGRVGRGGQQAYAYMLVPNEAVISSDAKRRLQAIEEFCEMGSGFRIAARDLEIRGAGNLLGKQQSGQIEAVGFELYVQMLEQAVRERRGESVQEPLDPQIKLPVSAYIGDEYVEDPHQRLSLYKRLSSCGTISDLALLHGETLDRYGPIPESFEHLFQVMEIKILAKALGLERCEVTSYDMNFHFATNQAPVTGGVPNLIKKYGKKVRFSSPQSIEIILSTSVWSEIFNCLRDVLNILQGSTTPSLQ